MTTSPIRLLAILPLALLMFAAQTGSQAPSPVLSTLEVQKLVVSNEPGDNARLSAHFSALADRYAADAKRHTAMAQAFVAAPTRRVPANSASDHCRRLGQLNAQAAETLRELAAHHKQLASGAVSTPPRDGARFQAGIGAPEPTDAELTVLAAKASTPTDHRVLEEYFVSASRRYTAEANAHVAMGQAYRGTRITQAAAHCDRLVTLSRHAAKEATAAAAMHKQFAALGV